jgi:hypothetical protein
MPSWGRWSRRCRPGGPSARSTCLLPDRCIGRAAGQCQRPRRILAPHPACGSRWEANDQPRRRRSAHRVSTPDPRGSGKPSRSGIGLPATPQTGAGDVARGCVGASRELALHSSASSAEAHEPIRGGRRRRGMTLTLFTRGHVGQARSGEADRLRPLGMLPPARGSHPLRQRPNLGRIGVMIDSPCLRRWFMSRRALVAPSVMGLAGKRRILRLRGHAAEA